MHTNPNELMASDVMQVAVRTVPPNMPLPRLEAEFLDAAVSGFPVVDEGRLVGVISRSDIIRSICSERDIASRTSDFYFDDKGFHEVPMESLSDIAARVGQRLDARLVQDAMVSPPQTVSVETPISLIARRFEELHVHRLPVVENYRLVGLITTMDLVRLIADHRLKCHS